MNKLNMIKEKVFSAAVNSVCAAKQLASLTSDRKVLGLSPIRVQLITVWLFIITISLSRYDFINVERA